MTAEEETGAWLEAADYKQVSIHGNCSIGRSPKNAIVLDSPKISPIYRKKTSTSTNLLEQGSKLTIRWPGTRIIDWSPKSIPRNVIQPRLDEPMVVTCTLKGD